jgi:hypothetical protein
VTCLMRTRNDMLLNAAQTLELIDQEKFNLYKKRSKEIFNNHFSIQVYSSTSIKLMIMFDILDLLNRIQTFCLIITSFYFNV